MLVPARRAVCDLGIWGILGVGFGDLSGDLSGDFGMPRALRAVIWVRGPICIDIYNIYMYYI